MYEHLRSFWLLLGYEGVEDTVAQPLYASLARGLRSAISSGQYGTGSLLPGEHELARTHGVSRATARAALGLLQQQGLVERRPGDGTRVLPPQPADGLGQSVDSITELINYAQHSRRVVQSVADVVIDQDQAARLGLTPGTRWLQLDSLRIDPRYPADPICYSKAYIAEELAGTPRLTSNETTALCDLLSAYNGIVVADVEQEMRGALIPSGLAESLNAPTGSAALSILRRYSDMHGWVFLVTVGLHPASRFAYRMKLERPAPASPISS